MESRRLQCYIVLLLGDVLAVALGFALAAYVYLGDPFDAGNWLQFQLILPLFLLIGMQTGAYSAEALASRRASIKLAIVALAWAAAVVLFVAFLTKMSTRFSRVGFVVGVLASMTLAALVRDSLRDFIVWRCGERARNLLVINDGVALTLPGALAIDARVHGLQPDVSDPDALDRLAHHLANIDRVLVACPPERRLAWALALKGTAVPGEVLDLAVTELGAISAARHGEVGALVVSSRALGLRARAFKRAIDLSLASVALVLLGPLMVLVALAIKLEDRGPVLFRQRRMGRSNRYFTIYKFRSMRPEQSGTGPAVRREDKRLTRVGRLIRRTSIDELPQLFNVLRGEMSIVGPRPHSLGSTAGDRKFWEIDQRYWQRHSLKPGLTGLAQVRGLRGKTELESDLSGRLQSDFEYMAGWTPMRDLGIIAATLRVLVHRNAF